MLKYALVAQWIAHRTSNPAVVSSSLTEGANPLRIELESFQFFRMGKEGLLIYFLQFQNKD